MSEEINAVVIIHPTPGKESRLKEVLLDLASNVEQNGKGVPKFQVFEQYDSKTGTNVFLAQETYSSQSAVDAHLASPYFTTAVGLFVKEELVTQPPEQIAIKPIGGFASR